MSDLFNEDRQERQRFMEAPEDAEVLLPITKDGFEALIEAAAKIYNLPVDDAMRMIAAGFIHHIPNETCTITIGPLADVMYKGVSNTMTWEIDQEIKKKRNKEMEDKKLSAVTEH